MARPANVLMCLSFVFHLPEIKVFHSHRRLSTDCGSPCLRKRPEVFCLTLLLSWVCKPVYMRVSSRWLSRSRSRQACALVGGSV